MPLQKTGVLTSTDAKGDTTTAVCHRPGFMAVLVFLFSTLCLVCPPSSWGGAVSNQDCVSCHEEKGLTKPGPKGKDVSLFFDAAAFKKSVHHSLQCVDCHDIKEVPHPDASKVRACASCHAEAEKVHKGSVHKDKASCKECHGYHTVTPAAGLRSSACKECHVKPYLEFQSGVHAKGLAKGSTAASCADCHGSPHAILASSDRKSPIYHRNLPVTCGRCHSDKALMQKYGVKAADSYSLFMDSIHGRALSRSGAQGVAANCSDCHGSHAIKPTADPASPASKTNIGRTCAKCHGRTSDQFAASIHGQLLKKGDPSAPSCGDCHPAHRIVSVGSTDWKLGIIRECGTCHKNLLDTYRHTYHGKITNLGYVRVAKCVDCHGSHSILPASDPASQISPSQRLATCKKCHPSANPNFAGMIVHVDYWNRKGQPHLYWTWIFMSALLIGVFGFFGTHAVLGLIRGWVARVRRLRSTKEEK
jgi:hypothetical protein